KLVDFGANIDRWQIIDFSPPCFVKLDLGGAPTGSGARQGDRSKGFERKSLNALTPETGTSIHYFWADAHNFDIDKPEVTRLLFDQVHEAFMEDKAFLEAQQRAFDRDGGRPLVDINADAGGLEARRILDRLLAEQDRRAPPETVAV
ncbi:MAG: aromatic ring-hydroxylating dioxygenase subunit alpha, partial [Defluviicoccus sp.]|nr:aromatic ring-hydroxylating dioxygenase subunit alpha [Defluviicoccus sp.]